MSLESEPLFVGLAVLVIALMWVLYRQWPRGPVSRLARRGRKEGADDE